MFFLRENETLYLDNWNYNAALIMDELRKIVSDNGGKIKPQKPGNIVKRSLIDAIRKNRDDAEQVRARLASGEVKNAELSTAYLERLEKEAAELEAIPNEPRPVSGGTYIIFILDGIYYEFSFDDNPFFEFYYRKTPVINGKYSRDAVGEEINKDFLWDCFFSATKPATDEDRREAANMIFNQLTTAKNCNIRRDATRRRVSNTFNRGYHYETIYAPERLEKVEF